LRASRISVAIAVITVLFSTVVLSEITPGPKARERGELAVVIVASDSPRYIEEWLGTPSKHDVTIKRLKTVRPNQMIVTSFLVTGLSMDKQGKYRFSVSFELLDPSKKVVFDDIDYAHGVGELPSNPTFIMADPALDLYLEPSDPAGNWSVSATVHDKINGKIASDVYTIELVK